MSSIIIQVQRISDPAVFEDGKLRGTSHTHIKNYTADGDGHGVFVIQTEEDTMSYGCDWTCECGWGNLDVRKKCRHCGKDNPDHSAGGAGTVKPSDAPHLEGCDYASSPIWLCKCPRPAPVPEPEAEGEAVAHPDDLAVDRFAAVMKEKLAKKRAQGRRGWEDKSDCTNAFLTHLLREHVEKGDPVDVGNLAMMIHQRGERIG